MLREKQRFLSSMHKLLDVFITCAAFILAIATKKFLNPEEYSGFYNESHNYLILLIIIIWYVVFRWTAIYKYSDDLTCIDIFANATKAVLISASVLSSFFFLFKFWGVSRMVLLTFLFYNVMLLCLSKLVIIQTIRRLNSTIENKKHILIVGTKERAINLIKGIEDRSVNTYNIIGCLDLTRERIGESVVNGYRIIGCIEDLEKHLIENIVDEVVFALPLRIINNADQYIAMAEDMGVHVRIIPDWQLHYLMYEPDIATIKFKEMAGTPTMSLHMTTPNEGALMLKSFFDFMASLIILILISPLMALIAISTKYSQRVLYSSNRKDSGCMDENFKFISSEPWLKMQKS